MPDSPTFLFLLPPAGAAAHNAAPDRWWLVDDGGITRRGTAADWPGLLLSGAGRPRCTGIAPACNSAIHWADTATLTLAQASAAARIDAARSHAAPGDSLHIVAGDPVPGEAGRPVITTATAALLNWLSYAEHIGAPLDAIVPAALIAPRPAGAGLINQLDIGDAPNCGEKLWRADRLAMLADPAIGALVAPGAAITTLGDGDRDAALVVAALYPPANLRSGAFAPAAAPLIDRAWLRRAAMLLGVVLLLSIGIAVTRIVRFHAAAAALDDAAVTAAATVLNSQPSIERAVANLDARLARRGAGPAPIQPLAALIAALEPHAAVGLDSVNWRSNGTLTVTLGAPQPGDINPVLIALQSAGYRITAQPRTGSDGRALGDVTVRTTP